MRQNEICSRAGRRAIASTQVPRRSTHGRFDMNKLAIRLSTLALMLSAVPAHAQLATRTWVSGDGDDQNTCTRALPCKTFAAALAKTARDGEISVLDPGPYGTVFINKSITINGTPGAGYGSIIASGVTGVTINIVDPSDIKRTVRLNWLDINGIGLGLHGIRIASGNLPGTVVVVENTNIDGFSGRGISDERNNGGKLVIADTVVKHTQLSGIQINPVGAQIDATLSNVRVHNAAVAGLTANGGSKVMITNSIFSGSTFGLDIEQANTEALAENVTLSGNTTGMFIAAGAILRLSNSSVAFNGTAVAGTVQSFSNNRFVGNGALGTITPIGSPSSTTGLQ
jgi:Right handed beta helix region